MAGWARALAVLGLFGSVLVFGVVLAPAASACSCVGLSSAEAFETADNVFFGEVLERETTPDNAVYVVAVGSVYKGEVAATQEVVSATNGAACGLELPDSGTALFFAYPNGDSITGKIERTQLAANLCGGTEARAHPPVSWGAGEPPSGTIDSAASTRVDVLNAAGDSNPALGLVILIGICAIVAVLLGLAGYLGRPTGD